MAGFLYETFVNEALIVVYSGRILLSHLSANCRCQGRLLLIAGAIMIAP